MCSRMPNDCPPLWCPWARLKKKQSAVLKDDLAIPAHQNDLSPFSPKWHDQHPRDPFLGIQLSEGCQRPVCSKNRRCWRRTRQQRCRWHRRQSGSLGRVEGHGGIEWWQDTSTDTADVAKSYQDWFVSMEGNFDHASLSWRITTIAHGCTGRCVRDAEAVEDR